jgi:hypothetical protein
MNSFQNINSIDNNISRFKSQAMITNESERKTFNEIDSIVEVLCQTFPKNSKDDIINALKITSFNIANAYFYLTNPKDFASFAFTDVDDYVIKNMKGSDHYQQLFLEKGEDVVKARLKFLNIEDDYE